MNQDDIYNEMKKLADQHNVELTDNAVNIARFRARTGLPMDRCPCHPTISAPDRGCIGTICLREIETLGQCCCRCFKKR